MSYLESTAAKMEVTVDYLIEEFLMNPEKAKVAFGTDANE
jgi:hypothetical protein